VRKRDLGGGCAISPSWKQFAFSFHQLWVYVFKVQLNAKAFKCEFSFSNLNDFVSFTMKFFCQLVAIVKKISLNLLLLPSGTFASFWFLF